MGDLFDITLHYGGKFVTVANEIHYIDGQVREYYDFDRDRFGFFEIEEIVNKEGFYQWDKLAYCIPGCNLNEGLRDIKTDKEAIKMLDYLVNNLIDIYIVGKEIEAVVGENMEGNGLVDVNVGDECNDSFSEAMSSVNKNNKEVSDSEEEGESEDPNYVLLDQSNTDDGLSDSDMETDDKEYLKARKNVKQYKNKKVIEKEPAPKFPHIHHNMIPGCSSVSTIGNESVNNEFVSHYNDSNGEVDTIYSSDELESEEVCCKKRKRYPTYDPNSDHKMDTVFKLGMKFDDGVQCREAIQKYAITNAWEIRFIRSSKTQVEAACQKGCPWRLYGSMREVDCIFKIKVYVGSHACHKVLRNRQATSTWIAKTYINKFRRRPNWDVKDMEDDIKEKYGLTVSIWKCYRARIKALDMLRGSLKEHYAKLRSYKAELMRVDREGRFQFKMSDTKTPCSCLFQRFYIGFSSLVQGFLRGCRPVIGLDGTFLKTHLGGALLVAVGKDGNNQMFSICWAVVERENEQSWFWFLQLLFTDLGISTGLGWTFVSDQQKELTPHAEHRNCARHLYANWRKTHKGQSLKKVFWQAARSTYMAKFNDSVKEIKDLSAKAANAFMEIGPPNFCKAFISTFPKSDMIDNNVSKTFNGYIVSARAKHIIDMLEDIRSALMERMHTKMQSIMKCDDVICPRIRKKLEENKYFTRFCYVKPAVNEEFQVSVGEDQFVVSLKDRTCSCRYWDLNGIPCYHACACITYMKMDPVEYVDDCYSITRYLKAYEKGLKPLNGSKMWPITEGHPMLPPPVKKMPGRQKKKRNTANDEDLSNLFKLPKIGCQMKCQLCGTFGHNRRTCLQKDNPDARIPPKPLAKRGRPPKAKPTEANETPAPRRNAKRVRPETMVQAKARATENRERRNVRQGFRVRVFEDTGNIYMRMPSARRLTVVHESGGTNINAAVDASHIQQPTIAPAYASAPAPASNQTIHHMPPAYAPTPIQATRPATTRPPKLKSVRRTTALNQSTRPPPPRTRQQLARQQEAIQQVSRQQGARIQSAMQQDASQQEPIILSQPISGVTQNVPASGSKDMH